MRIRNLLLGQGFVGSILKGTVRIIRAFSNERGVEFRGAFKSSHGRPKNRAESD